VPRRRVLRRVLVDQDEPLHLDLVARHALGEADDRAVLGRREVLAVLGDGGDVLVLADGVVAGPRLLGHPVEGAGGLLHPVDGRLLAQGAELVVRDCLLVDERIGEVESLGDDIGGCHV
jgi:hypothetical protein